MASGFRVTVRTKATKTLMIAVAKALPTIALGLVMMDLFDMGKSKQRESSRLAQRIRRL
jgi:hypothetical protein